MDPHPEIPRVAFFRLVYFRISLLFLGLGETGRGDQGGDHYRALAHRHAPGTEVGFNGLKDPIAQPVLLQQMAKSADRRLSVDSIADQLDAGNAAHGGHLDQGLHHCRIAQGNTTAAASECGASSPRGGRRAAAFLVCFGVVGLEQSDQRLPWHDCLHLSEKLLPLGLLLGCSQLVIREAEQLTASHTRFWPVVTGPLSRQSLGFPRVSLGIHL